MSTPKVKAKEPEVEDLDPYQVSVLTVEVLWERAATTHSHRRRKIMALPEEGWTRCSCGSKYWDGDVCHSCGTKWDRTLTVEEYRDLVDQERVKREAKRQPLRGLHNFLEDIRVPDATHYQLVKTDECFSSGCPDHGWM